MATSARNPVVYAILLAALTVPAGVLKGAEPEMNEQRLAEVLKQFPAADADGDGNLTPQEASAFLGTLTGSQPAPTLANVRYGAHRLQALDLWQAQSESPTPLIIHFHGGGFVFGEKAAPGWLGLALASGISVISADYRLAGVTDVTFRGIFEDGGRVIQFARSKARDWNIDPNRIAVCGESAGGNMALWLALHADLADPQSADPVARLSTRVRCAFVDAAQTTNDPRVILKHIGGSPEIHPTFKLLLRSQGISATETPEHWALVEELSPLHHATSDDPPIYMTYGSKLSDAPLPATAPIDSSIHHAMFGKLLKDRLDALKVPCYLQHDEQPAGLDLQEFVRIHLLGE